MPNSATKTSSPPSVSCPCASFQVPRASTASAPVSSITSTIGPYTERMRAETIAARNRPVLSRANRPSSVPCRLYACTSAMLPSDSSAIALIEPLRRRRSRDAALTSREKRRAAPQKSGTITSARRVKSQRR